MTVLTRRALNRATLARQLLLERVDRPVPEVVAHLAGLQAQTTTSWYLGLWNRLANFTPEPVNDLITGRRLVRLALMRGTIHLVTAADAVDFRLAVQPVIVRGMMSSQGRHVTGVALPEVVAAGREILEREPLTFSELGRRLAQRWPDSGPPDNLAQVVRAYAALVQLPPRGLWGHSGLATHTTAEQWLGRPLNLDPDPAPLLLRYLGAFGPATVADAQAFTGLTRLAEVFARLRPGLVSLRGENGKELFDLPDSPRPDPATVAPVRLLYDFDNLLLSYADRSRVLPPGARELLWTRNLPMYGGVLVDGSVTSGWRLHRARAGATLEVRSLAPLRPADRAAVQAEAARLLAFLAPGDAVELRFTVVD